jgi:hypothetical protein
MRTEWWSACISDGFEVPGWVFLETRRHTEGPMGMNEAEAEELGGLLVRLTGAIEAATGAEKVYIVAYGELFPHFHVLLSPRLPFAPPDLTGPGLFLQRAELIDVDAAAEMALAICRALSAQE